MLICMKKKHGLGALMELLYFVIVSSCSLTPFLFLVTMTTKSLCETIGLPLFDDPQSTFAISTREYSSLSTFFLQDINTYFSNPSTIVFERSAQNPYGPYAYATPININTDAASSTLAFAINTKNGNYLQGIKIDFEFSFDAGTRPDQNLAQATSSLNLFAYNNPSLVRGYPVAEAVFRYGAGTYQGSWMKTAGELKQDLGIIDDIINVELSLYLELFAASNLYRTEVSEPASVSLNKILISNVPEPSSLSLLLAGGAVFAAARRRKVD